MDSLILTIYESTYRVLSDNPTIIQRLRLDFSHFLLENHREARESLYVHIQEPPWEILPKTTALKQTETSIIYEEGNVRFNDYHGEALTSCDRTTGENHVYSPNLQRAHELSYLLILSKSGKEMDLKGYHKLHAMGIQYKNANLLLVSSSKGGKSTHFLKLLEDSQVKIYSDDTPVIDGRGNITPFPLRVGSENFDQLPDFIDKSQTYSLERKSYGKKNLIPLKAMNREIATDSPSKKTFLVIGKRSRKDFPERKKISTFHALAPMAKYFIVGFGLPMILEYFFESGFKDIFKRTVIILKRTRACFALLWRAEIYEIELSPDIQKNTELLKKLMSEE